ncbi:MAG: hypothetical protein HQL67_04370 [Magnetococcales bacterium]|nr:hypothetical protein [Magnetococcales bacterium]
MADSTQQVSGVSHAELVAQAQQQAATKQATKAHRDEILGSQDRKAENSKAAVTEPTNPTSSHHDAAKVSLSGALSDFIKENKPTENTFAFIQRTAAGLAETERKAPTTKQETVKATEAFFERLDQVRSSQLNTALDNLRGYIELRPSTHQIDLMA